MRVERVSASGNLRTILPMPNIRPFRPLLVALALAGLATPAVAIFSGYDAILSRIPKTATASSGSASAFYRDRDALLGDLPNLAPDEAAKRWLAVAEAYLAVRQQDWWSDNDRDYDDRSFQALLKALPGPDSWGAIVAGIGARKPDETGTSLALRTLAAALSGDGASRDSVYADAKKWVAARAKKNPRHSGGGDGQILAFYVTPGSPQWIEAEKAAWRAAVAGLDAPDSSFSLMNNRPHLGSEIPDLVKFFGEAQAREDLKKVFLSGANVHGSMPGGRTRELIGEVALATVAEQKHPAWFAVNEESDPALFEALQKKFPVSERHDYAREQAFSAYLGALVRAGRTNEAAAGAVAEFRKTGRAPEVGSWSYSKKIPAGALADFYSKALAAEPAIPVYETYIRVAAHAGRAEESLGFVRKVAARTDLSPEAKRLVGDFETTALLAADKVDEALPRLLAVLAEKLPPSPAADDNSPEGLRGREAHDRLKSRRAAAIQRVLALGKVLNRTDLTDAGLAATREELKGATAGDAFSDVRELFGLLIDAGRYEDVERLAEAWLVAKGSSAASGGNNSDAEKIRSVLKSLFTAYHKAGRPADAIAVLEKSPQWGESDLRGVLGPSWNHADDARIAVDVGEDLVALGRNGEAKRLADFAVMKSPGLDAAYALLLKLTGAGDEFLARMDAQFAKDRFEERPLIWKAKALYELSRYDDALAVAKAAVAIDPSDGEQGKGDRLRAYAVLADILEKKGDAATAGVYRGAVSAIRIGEGADDLYSAGLLKRALSEWERSLTLFADAYCVQSRLAVRYAESGDMAKAETHYTRAFELMPDSFGRIESHCFGCEGAFEGEVAQGVAEKVFSGVVAKNPANPRAHYLIGYLRSEQGRWAEAAEAYRKAVALDPDYFNAWSKLGELAEKTDLPPEEVTRCSMAKFRLDPSGRHGGGLSAVEGIDNLKFVWRTLAAAGVEPVEDKSPLFPLPAAKAQLDKAPKSNRSGFVHRGSFGGKVMMSEAVARHRLVQAAVRLSQYPE